MSLVFNCPSCDKNPCRCLEWDKICIGCWRELENCICADVKPNLEEVLGKAVGVKYDGEKPELYLLPPRALIEVGKVLTYGARKYAPDNWKKVPQLHERYTSAALRHILADMAGEKVDEETGISHLAHAMCCLLFRLEAEIQDEENQEEGTRES